MPVQTIFRNVQFAADEPFREGRLPFDYFLPRRAPGQFLRFARPELGRLSDRFSIHSPILSQALDPRLAAESRWRLENAFFDQMRFDVVMHGQFLVRGRTFQGKRASSVATGVCRSTTLVMRWTVTGPWLHVRDARAAARRTFHA